MVGVDAELPRGNQSGLRLNRREALRVLASGAGLIIVAGCGGPQSAPPASSTSAAPASAATPAAAQRKTGGTLRFAQTATPVSIDGNSIAGGGSETSWLVFDRLTSYDLNLKPQPMLAESWDISSDFKQFKLNLRKGVQFHSGREFTSDDVKYTILRLRQPTVGSGILAGFSNWFSSIDLPDKYTVVLGSDTPRPTFFDAIELFNMVDKDNVEGPDAKSTIVGTGPFTFVQWQNGDHFTVARNKNYWQTGQPYVDTITTYIRDQQTMDLQLESAALDVVKIPSVDDFVRLKSDPTYQAVIHPASGTFFEVGFNTARKPFDDKRVRQAFNFAMDRKRFVDVIMKGTAIPINLPWSQSSPAYDASKNNTYSFDLDKAKSLLKDAGVANLETDILVNGIGAPQVLAFSQIYADSLASIGVKLNIKNVEPPVWVDVLINKKPDYTGLWAGTDQIAQLAPSTLFQLSPGWRIDNNHSAFKSDTWTTLVNSTLSETDLAKQQQLYAQLNDFILDQSFTVALATYPYTVLMRGNVHDVGYVLHNGGLNLATAWLAWAPMGSARSTSALHHDRQQLVAVNASGLRRSTPGRAGASGRTFAASRARLARGLAWPRPRSNGPTASRGTSSFPPSLALVSSIGFEGQYNFSYRRTGSRSRSSSICELVRLPSAKLDARHMPGAFREDRTPIQPHLDQDQDQDQASR